MWAFEKYNAPDAKCMRMGYLPPEHLYVEGGYEISSIRFTPKAAGMVVKQAVKMLHEL